MKNIIVGLLITVALQALLLVSPTPLSAQFRRVGKNIMAPGTTNAIFRMKGVNLQIADFNNYNRSTFNNGVYAKLAARKVNCVRIVWRAQNPDANFEKLNAYNLGLQIGLLANNKIISMAELHDFTGVSARKIFTYGSAPGLKGNGVFWCARWWHLNYKRIYAGFQKTASAAIRTKPLHNYLIINIANEFSNAGSGDNGDHWMNSYIAKQNFGGNVIVSPLQYIRRSGYGGVIVVDGFNWAQSPQALWEGNRAAKILSPAHNGDPNVAFAIHTWDEYSAGGRSQTYGRDLVGDLAAFTQQPYPVIIGEFGPRNYSDTEIDIAKIVDHPSLSWFAWTWWGEGGKDKNGKSLADRLNLVLSTTTDWTYSKNAPMHDNLSNFGTRVFTGLNYTIKNPGRVLSVFEEDIPEIAITTPAPKLEVTVGDLTAKLFPNPTGGAFNLEFNSPAEDNIEVAVYDLKGSRLKQYKQSVVTGENRLELMAPDQPGVYVVQALTDTGKRFASTLVVSE